MKCERSAGRVPGSGSLQRATQRRCGCDRNASSAMKVAPSKALPVLSLCPLDDPAADTQPHDRKARVTCVRNDFSGGVLPARRQAEARIFSFGVMP
jgi:hypothetical protein